MKSQAFRGILATLTTMVVALSFGVVAEAATPSSYVALGDSYASGNGAGSYLTGTANASCYRSKKGYPYLVAAGSKLALNLQACSGATIADVTNKQVGALTADTAYVTVTVGGNDLGFASVLTTCLGTNTTACLNAVAAAASTAGSSPFRTKLRDVYSLLKAKAPNATIVATAYPRLFNGKDCSILTSFTSAEMTKLNEGADALSSAIKTEALAAGIRYAEVAPPFVGHEVCARSAWIVNASLFKTYESFHPTATGHSSGYKPAVASALGLSGTTTGTAFKVTTGGVTSSDTARGNVKVPKS